MTKGMTLLNIDHYDVHATGIRCRLSSRIDRHCRAVETNGRDHFVLGANVPGNTTNGRELYAR